LGNFDSNANVQAISLGVVPTKVAADPNPENPGGLVVTYHLGRRLATGESVPISLYWSSGPRGSNALPADAPKALSAPNAPYTYVVTSKEAPGTHTFPVHAAWLTTAPSSTTYLLVISDPAHNLKGGDGSDPNAVLADKAQIADPANRQLAPLTAGELQKLMPRLDANAASRYAPVLAQAMFDYGITTLEQEAMFLANLAVESRGLTRWTEETYVGHLGKPYHLPGSRKATYKATSVEDFYNYWYAKVNGNGDKASGDGYNFRGGGPIQLTGHDNYQAFSNYLVAHHLDGITDPSMIMDDTDAVRDQVDPAVGLESAGWFWGVHAKLNTKTDKAAGHTSTDFATTIAHAVNGANATPGSINARLKLYLKIRGLLLDADFPTL
jgi:putative chitinase